MESINYWYSDSSLARSEVQKSLDQYTLLINPSLPRAEGCGTDVEALRRLAGRPAASGPEFQNRHALQRFIMRAAMRLDPLHPGVLDAEFLLEQGDLVIPAVDLGLQANLTILTVGRPRQWPSELSISGSHGIFQTRQFDSVVPIPN